jgi:mutual gliding-motility protein MglA
MALLNHATKELTAKLVYYGPGLGGKTTNLQWIHDHLAFESKGKLVSLATQTDRTLFFDFLPVELGTIRGLRARMQIYTVPGQVFYEATRRMVLKGCDAIVFVADSQAAMLDANAESQRSLRQNLLVNEIDPSIPQVIQYNKRDLPTALPLSVLDERLNAKGVPAFEAVALKGVGVEETLKGITRALFHWLARYYGEADGEPGVEARSASVAVPIGPSSVVSPKPVPAARSAPVGVSSSARMLPPPVSAAPTGLPAASFIRAQPVPAPSALPGDPLPDGQQLGADQWLYLLDGAQHGPIAFDGLVDLVLTKVPENTKVWRPELEGWLPANRVPQIAEELPPPLPIPGLARGWGDEDMPDFNTVPSMLRTVLIADEDQAFRKYLAMPLAAQGFTIYEAADGAAAWQLAVQNRPWMILADISMPEVDGFEFCRRVRNHPMLARLPLLFISGSDKYKERYRALQIGADDFLSKNLPVRELLMRIQLLMTRYSDLAAAEPASGAADPAGAFHGRIEVFGAPALLQMCAQSLLDGVFTSFAEDAQNSTTVIGFRGGAVVSAAVGKLRGPEAVYAFLGWTKGSFKFTPGDPGSGEPLAQSVEHLLLEGCRLLDEAQQGGPDPGGAPGS